MRVPNPRRWEQTCGVGRKHSWLTKDVILTKTPAILLNNYNLYIKWPPRKYNTARLRRGWGIVLGRRTGIWSTEVKVWGIVPRDCIALRWQCCKRSLRGTGQHPVVCMGPCWWRLFNSSALMGQVWTTRNIHEKWRRHLNSNFDA
jgi:hypothetical protein